MKLKVSLKYNFKCCQPNQVLNEIYMKLLPPLLSSAFLDMFTNQDTLTMNVLRERKQLL